MQKSTVGESLKSGLIILKYIISDLYRADWIIRALERDMVYNMPNSALKLK